MLGSRLFAAAQANRWAWGQWSDTNLKEGVSSFGRVKLTRKLMVSVKSALLKVYAAFSKFTGVSDITELQISGSLSL